MTTEAGPRLRLEFVPPAAPISVGVWRCRWLLSNIGTEPLRLNAAWLPHGQFRAERESFDPPIAIAGGASQRISFDVACSEPAGTRVENAFVILTAEMGGEEWRAFARLTVGFGPGGVPAPRTELVSSSVVGFSEAPEPSASV